MIWIELTVSGQTVQKSLDIRSEDGVKSCIIDFIQMFSKTVPEVKGDLHDLDQKTDPDDNLKIYEDQNIKGRLLNLDQSPENSYWRCCGFTGGVFRCRHRIC